MQASNTRGVLVLAHIVAITIAAIPSPGGAANQAALDAPAAAAELRMWGARLGVAPEALKAWAIKAGAAEDEVHHAISVPFRPYLRFTGAEQPWRLFIAPNRWPTRFQIEVWSSKAPAKWQTVFEEGSKEYSWRGSTLAHERPRSYLELLSWPNFAWLGPAVCRWAAKGLFEERKDVVAVRCRNYRAPSPSPEQAARGEQDPGEWLVVDTVAR
jgi:hypothetical protein